MPTLQPWHAANFYPRSPCGERRQTPGEMVCGQNFYPRSPCGERLTNANSPKSDNIISIHALLAESDTASSILMVAPSNFYPRSPCGERLGRLMLVMALSDFYPRSPCGERPILGNPCAGCPAISIHALLAESDAPCPRCSRGTLPISIHALLAESDQAKQTCRAKISISIHALLAESDSTAFAW